jgi:hypothetical protein
MKLNILKACGHHQEFEADSTDPRLGQKLRRFQETRCKKCVAELQAKQKAAAIRRKMHKLKRRLPLHVRQEAMRNRWLSALEILTGMHANPLYRQMTLAGKVQHAIEAADELLAQLVRE